MHSLVQDSLLLLAEEPLRPACFGRRRVAERPTARGRDPARASERDHVREHGNGTETSDRGELDGDGGDDECADEDDCQG